MQFIDTAGAEARRISGAWLATFGVVGLILTGQSFGDRPTVPLLSLIGAVVGLLMFLQAKRFIADAAVSNSAFLREHDAREPLARRRVFEKLTFRSALGLLGLMIVSIIVTFITLDLNSCEFADDVCRSAPRKYGEAYDAAFALSFIFGAGYLLAQFLYRTSSNITDELETRAAAEQRRRDEGPFGGLSGSYTGA